MLDTSTLCDEQVPGCEQEEGQVGGKGDGEPQVGVQRVV